MYSYTDPLSVNRFRDHDLTVKSKSYFKGFNNVILMHTHQECTDKIDLLSISKDFVTSNERHVNYFGHCLYVTASLFIYEKLVKLP